MVPAGLIFHPARFHPRSTPVHTFKTERHFDAPPPDVFSAIRDPARLARWWGPDGFTNRFEVCEFRAGGRWVFDMVGPNGQVYPNESVFERVEPDHLVVVRHVCQPHFTLTIDLEPQAQGTRVRWTQVFDDADLAQAIAHIVVPGNEQNLDRWAAELAAAQPG
jgi:uncharacterized protein YndB with AHSA1/START domain